MIRNIGVDFDNTLISYDQLIYQIARERGWISKGSPRSKREIRDELRKKPQGDLLWQEIQALIYGERIMEALPMPGVTDFFSHALRTLEENRDQYSLQIISHKTSRAVRDTSGIDLRAQALRWLERFGFFSLSTHFGRPNVFFETTLDAKVGRIGEQGCHWFIDDLIEVLGHPKFPAGCRRVLLGSPPSNGVSPDGIVCAANWAAVASLIFDIARPSASS